MKDPHGINYAARGKTQSNKKNLAVLNDFYD